MLNQVKSQSQGLLFSEPSIAETGVWCELNDGINPEEWASVCKHIGSLNPQQFNRVKKKIVGNPDSFFSRLKRVFCFNQADCEGISLIKLDY